MFHAKASIKKLSFLETRPPYFSPLKLKSAQTEISGSLVKALTAL